jgi:flagellar biosynthesis GTPase FlhF
MSGFIWKFRLSRSWLFWFSLASVLTAVYANAVFAEATAVNRITDISVDSGGQLILTVEGEGLDPLVRLEPAPNQQYRIIIQGEGALLLPRLIEETASVSASIKQQIPAVEAAQLSTGNQESGQFQVVLTSWQKLQPQIRSNTGSRIVITLVGNHALPPAIAAKQKLEAERKRQAELKKLAEAAAVRKAEEHRKQQAELQKKQAEIAAQKAEALRKQAAEEAARKQALQQQRAETQKKQAQAESARTQGMHVPKAAQAKSSATKPETLKPVAVSSEQLQSDWITAYRSQPQPTTDEPMAQLQLVQSLPKPFSPKMLALDKIPPPTAILPGLTNNPADEPTEPIRLNAPPPGLLLDQGNFDWTPTPLSVPQTPKQTSPPESVYAITAQPNIHMAVRKAWKDLQAGNATSAEIGLRAYLEQSPGDTTARLLLGQILLKPAIEALATGQNTDAQARREAARQEFLKLIHNKPSLLAYQALIELALEDENYQEANQLWTKASALDANSVWLIYQKGRIQEGQNGPEAARESYLQALTKDPSFSEAHLRLAQVELTAGHLDAARWELVQALRGNCWVSWPKSKKIRNMRPNSIDRLCTRMPSSIMAAVWKRKISRKKRSPFTRQWKPWLGTIPNSFIIWA